MSRRWRRPQTVLRAEGQTVVYVASGTRLLGLLGVADPIKESTREAIRLLRDDGIRVTSC